MLVLVLVSQIKSILIKNIVGWFPSQSQKVFIKRKKLSFYEYNYFVRFISVKSITSSSGVNREKSMFLVPYSEPVLLPMIPDSVYIERNLKRLRRLQNIVKDIKYYKSCIDNQKNKIVNRNGYYDFELESLKNLQNLLDSLNLEDESEFFKVFNEIDKLYKDIQGINSKGFINDTNLLKYPIIGQSILLNYKNVLEEDEFAIVTKAYAEDVNKVDVKNDIYYYESMSLRNALKVKYWERLEYMYEISNSKEKLIKENLVKERSSKGKSSKIKVKDEELYLGNDLIYYDLGIELYKWSFNLVILKLYHSSEYMIYKIESKEEFKNLEILLDYKNLSRDLLLKLDPSIRSKLVKRGSSITQNIYTGFDTEYVNESTLYNRLLSVQLSVNSKTMLSLPLTPEFDYKEVDVLSGKDFKVKQVYGSNIRWELLKSMINNYIRGVRELKYGGYDKSIKDLVDSLKQFKSKGKLNYVKKDDSIIFIFDRSKIQQYFKLTDKFSLKELVKISYKMSKFDLDNDLNYIKDLLTRIHKGEEKLPKVKINDGDVKHRHGDEVVVEGAEEEDPEKAAKIKDLNQAKLKFDQLSSEKVDLLDLEKDNIENLEILRENKKYKRTAHTSYTEERLSVTSKINNYILAHYTPADISMLDDFEEYKNELDIVNKSFVTLKKPILIDGINVVVRDTKLITPGKKKLSVVASLYGGIDKVEIPKEYIKRMDLLLEKDPDLYRRYALQDSLISLIHGSFMEEFNHTLGGVGIPLTLSGLSKSFIKSYWDKNGYKGYQYSNKYPLNNVSKTLTPKGLSVVNEVGIKSTMYIANYKGGRNESFMYGYEEKTKWFDLDLVSCYTSVMLIVGAPSYKGGSVITGDEFINKMSIDQKIFSFTILLVDFEFPKSVKYPSIPCVIEEGTQIYPSKGSAVITSLDYLVAKRQGAKIEIKEVYCTPFKGYAKVQDPVKIKSKKKLDVVYFKPFASCIKEIQDTRSLYSKGTIENVLWKEIGNSIYGLVVQGINEKLKFDVRTNEMKRIEGSKLANPMIASWITSFARGVIGELLYCVEKLKGKAVSVTTDGFITDIEDLELKIQRRGLLNYGSLYNEYRKVRGNTDILEVKKSGLGILSWCTRGQLSVDSKIFAATGYQRGELSLSEVKDVFLNALKNNNELYYLEERLRSGKDIYQQGGHVTDIFSDKVYRLLYDNKRVIIEKEGETLLDSRPLKSVDEGKLLRYIGKLPKTSLYSRNMSNSISGKYKTRFELVIRNFLKALLKNELNLDCTVFKRYKDIVDYLKEYDGNIKVNENSMSQLKRRSNFVKVPRTPEGEAFVEFVKLKFPNFDEKGFYKSG